MRAFVRGACRFLRDRRGATAIEYGVMLGAIALVLFVGLRALGNTSTGIWNNVSAQVIENGPHP